jgi:hypothetical protein
LNSTLLSWISFRQGDCDMIADDQTKLHKSFVDDFPASLHRFATSTSQSIVTFPFFSASPR